ncbi:CoA pyrophosphatase [Marinospirillum sp. MEB164]|uniref:CoA pyrophosphatase n=1 Tax=Marinospirillum alkalitolerans TaxID=3123374 RepID=A0ABW8PT76_9GAMM
MSNQTGLITQLTERLAGFTAKPLKIQLPEAAVLVAITQAAEPEIILTQRAAHMSTHAGQVAFPGGKRDPQDLSLEQTALREAQEEVNLPPEDVQLLGRLSDVISLHGMKVTPYVGLVPDQLVLTPCCQELASVFRLPLSWLLDDPRTHTDVIQLAGQRIYIPSYTYQQYRIWGLSALILTELLQQGLGLDMDPYRQPAGRLVHHPERPLPFQPE